MTIAALVGLTAPHSKGWLETLRNSPEIECLHACDLDGAVPENDDGIAEVYSGLDALFDSVRPDFALVSVRNDLAAETGSRFLSEGIPVIIEKPAGRTAAEIAGLNELSRRHSTPWATGFTNRLAPAVCEIRRMVAAGALGRVVSVEGRMVTSSVEQRNKDHWLFSKEVAGGGILHWLAIHTIDLIRFTTGLEYDSVSAHVATLSDTGVDVEDTAAVFVLHVERSSRQPACRVRAAQALRRHRPGGAGNTRRRRLVFPWIRRARPHGPSPERSAGMGDDCQPEGGPRASGWARLRGSRRNRVRLSLYPLFAGAGRVRHRRGRRPGSDEVCRGCLCSQLERQVNQALREFRAEPSDQADRLILFHTGSVWLVHCVTRGKRHFSVTRKVGPVRSGTTRRIAT